MRTTTETQPITFDNEAFDLDLDPPTVRSPSRSRLPGWCEPHSLEYFKAVIGERVETATTLKDTDAKVLARIASRPLEPLEVEAGDDGDDGRAVMLEHEDTTPIPRSEPGDELLPVIIEPPPAPGYVPVLGGTMRQTARVMPRLTRATIDRRSREMQLALIDEAAAPKPRRHLAAILVTAAIALGALAWVAIA